MKKKSKKGVSVMIGYILLVTLAIVMGVVIYQWLKTYIPKEPLECPDGTSIFLREYSCDLKEIKITLENNGRFDIGGYFIKATDDPLEGVPTIDLSKNLVEEDSITTPKGGIVIFLDVDGSEGGNNLKTGETREETYNLDFGIYKLDITPFRFQKTGRTNSIVACSSSRVRYDLACS